MSFFFLVFSGQLLPAKPIKTDYKNETHTQTQHITQAHTVHSIRMNGLGRSHAEGNRV